MHTFLHAYGKLPFQDLLYKKRENSGCTSSIPGAAKRAIECVRFHVCGHRAGGCQEDDRSSQCITCGIPGHKVRECKFIQPVFRVQLKGTRLVFIQKVYYAWHTKSERRGIINLVKLTSYCRSNDQILGWLEAPNNIILKY